MIRIYRSTVCREDKRVPSVLNQVTMAQLLLQATANGLEVVIWGCTLVRVVLSCVILVIVWLLDLTMLTTVPTGPRCLHWEQLLKTLTETRVLIFL